MYNLFKLRYFKFLNRLNSLIIKESFTERKWCDNIFYYYILYLILNESEFCIILFIKLIINFILLYYYIFLITFIKNIKYIN